MALKPCLPKRCCKIWSHLNLRQIIVPSVGKTGEQFSDVSLVPAFEYWIRWRRRNPCDLFSNTRDMKDQKKITTCVWLGAKREGDWETKWIWAEKESVKKSHQKRFEELNETKSVCPSIYQTPRPTLAWNNGNNTRASFAVSSKHPRLTPLSASAFNAAPTCICIRRRRRKTMATNAE